MDISAQNRPYAGDERQLALGEVLEALIRDGHITADQARPLLSAYSHKQPADYGSHPLEIVARRKWHSLATPEMALSLERLTRWYAERSQLRYFRIDPLKVDVKAVTGVITRPYAERFQILPVEVDGDRVVVACAEPFRRDWEAELSRVLRIKIDRVFANPADVRRYLAEFYNLSQAIAGANRVHELADKSGVLNLEALLELGRADQLDANDHHVVNLVDWLLQYAFDQRASDIHLEPRRDKARIRFRIDGVLHTVNEIPPVVMAAVTSRIKSLGRMDIVEKRRPQDGRLKTRAPGGSEIELRLSTMPTAFGEKLVMRVFDPEVLKRSFDQLGLSAEDARRWQGMLSRPHGIVLVTGPTGSGKTTTLYSALRKLARPEVNVCTVEDPIEMVEPAFNQMQVQPAIGVDFATGVRNLLRQDPDIIMVGEIRDLETAEMAVQASLTGHLVLSTLHTNDAPSSVTRLLEIGTPAYQLRATLLGVVAQRLVRTLCTHCRVALKPEEVKWRGLRPPKGAEGGRYFTARGCDECRNTGYRGRIGLYEVLVLNSNLRSMIGDDLNLDHFRNGAQRQGMQTLRQSGALKVASGLTTVEEVMAVTPAGDLSL